MSFTKSRSLLTIGCLFALFALPAGPADAAATSESLDQSLYFEVPSVFGASKYEQKLTESPAAVSIVTAEEIQRYGYRTLGDVLASLPGFYLSNDHNYGYIGVRGFSQPGDYNSRILLLVDGHRLNDNLYSSAYAGRESALDIDLVERIEVIRGPSSSLYGSSALFAVINVTTKKGRDFAGAVGALEAGSLGSYEGRLSYGNRFSTHGEILLSGSYYDSQGADWYYPEFDDPATNNGLSQGRDWEEVRHGFLKFSYRGMTLSGAYNRRDDGYPTAAWDTLFNYPDAVTTDERAYLDLSYLGSPSPALLLSGRLFYDYYHYQGKYPYDYAAPGDPIEFVLFRDSARGQGIGSEIQADWRWTEGQHLIAGAELVNDYQQDQDAYDSDPFTLYFDDMRDSTRWALFAQNEMSLSENLLLNLGLRYDNFDSIDDFNPRLAIIWSVDEKTTFKLLYGSAFRAPNSYESFYNDGDLSQKANPNLNPEEMASYELVLERQLTEVSRSTLSIYYYDIDGLITLMTDPTDDLLVFQNLATAEVWGGELTVEGTLLDRLQGRVSYSCQLAEDGNGFWLNNSPRHLAKLNLGVPLWDNRLQLGLEEQFTSRRKTPKGGTSPAYAVTNLTLSTLELWRGLRLAASVYNLFDRSYSDPGALEHVQQTLEQDGRTYRLKLTLTF